MSLRNLNRSLALVGALTLAGTAGCDKKEEAPPPAGSAPAGASKAAPGSTPGSTAQAVKPGASTAAPTAVPALAAKPVSSPTLQFIPADTPYVFLNLETMPTAVADKIFGKLQPLAAEMEKKITEALAGMPAPATPKDKVGKAILEELKGRLNEKGLIELGISTTPHVAIYGLGVLPAMRVDLKDPAALKAAIGRIEAKAGEKAPVKKLGDQEYWSVAEHGMTFVAAIVGNELVLGCTPDALIEKVLPVLFGQKKPSPSLADTGVIAKIMADNALTPFGIGIVDGRGLAATLLGEGTGLNAEVFAALKPGPTTLSADCKTEIGLVENGPRLLFGTTQLDDKAISATYILEVKPDLAKALAALRAGVPGLADVPAGKPLFAMGAGLDLDKTLAFAKEKAAAITAAPYKCELFQGINQDAAQLTQKLGQPLPPFVQGIKGFNVVVQDAKMGPMMGPGGLPADLKAYGLLATAHPDVLIAFLKVSAPPFASLEVPPDGKPVALPPGALPPTVQAPYIAQNGQVIGVSVGEGVQTQLPELMKAAPGADPPLLSISYDIGRVMAMVGAGMEAAAANAPPEQKAQIEASMAMSKAVSGMIGLATYSLHMNEKGIVIKAHVALN